MSLNTGLAHAAPRSRTTTTLRPPYQSAWGSGWCTDMTGTATCTRSADGTIAGAISSSAEIAAAAPGGTAWGLADGVVNAWYRLTSPAPALRITMRFEVARADAAEETTGGNAHATASVIGWADHSECETCVADARVDVADSEEGTAEPADVTDTTFIVAFELRDASGGEIPAGTVLLRARGRSLAQFGYLVSPCGCAGSIVPAIGHARAAIEATVAEFTITRLAA